MSLLIRGEQPVDDHVQAPVSRLVQASIGSRVPESLQGCGDGADLLGRQSAIGQFGVDFHAVGVEPRHARVFLPALAPGFVAYLRVGRARRESFVDRADRRTILVVTAGMGALIAWAFCSPTDEGLVRSAIIVAGLVVGFVGLVEDEIAYTKVSAALRTEGLERATGAPLLAGPSAHVLDFGLGYTRAEVVIPAHEAYRDAPRRAAVFLGDGLEAKNALKYAIVRGCSPISFQ